MSEAFLRVWQPDDDEPRREAPGRLSPESTLSDFFHQYVWPEILGPKAVSPETRKEYLTSLAYWTRFTGDPPLVRIDDRTCTRFVRQLRAVVTRHRAPLSDTTVAKHCEAIQRLLDWAGRRGRRNRKGASLIDHAPYVERPGRPHKAPRPAFRLDELWDWLRVLPAAARPVQRIAQYDPAAWWTAFILVAYNTGLRPGAMFRMRWEQIEGNVLLAPASILKGRSDRQFWVNDFALAALEPIRRSAGLVFGWPDWPAARAIFARHMRRQQRAARIRELPPYGLRRAFATQAGKINPLAMQIQMGHVGLGMRMAAEHYVDQAELLGEALGRLPQPRPIVQKRLFE